MIFTDEDCRAFRDAFLAEKSITLLKMSESYILENLINYIIVASSNVYCIVCSDDDTDMEEIHFAIVKKFEDVGVRIEL